MKLSSLFENCVYPQFMRLQENEDSLEVLEWNGSYYHEENRAMLLEDDNNKDEKNN